MCRNDSAKSTMIPTRQRRQKRDKEGQYVLLPSKNTSPSKKKAKKQSKALQKHGKNSQSGGIEAMIPSLLGVGVLIFAVMAQRGFRGRASVAGIDLGTTNSVICVQAQSKAVGDIDCIEDPETGSPIIPSVVAFLQPHERKVGPSSKIKSLLIPHPSHVVVGQRAKHRIESHPHHTLYNAKRVLGRPITDSAIADLRHEVEFQIEGAGHDDDDDTNNEVVFRVDDFSIPPTQVGSYIVNHLIEITKAFLGHDNVHAAVLAVPAKFDALQRQRTMEAFKNAGVQVARVLEEPVAAALAYGLQKKENVEKILVYDFGGGTLDVSILHVSEGFVDVMGNDGDDRLGGADFDATVANLLASRHEQVLKDLSSYNVDAEELASTCSEQTNKIPLCSISSFHTLGEQLKISLSQTAETAHSTCLALPHAKSTDSNGHDTICDGLFKVPLQLSLEDYNESAKPLFDRSVLPITRLLQDLSLEPEEIDEIVMVGGTTRMPQIRALVSEAFRNAQLNTHIDPDITVAYGAASVID